VFLFRFRLTWPKSLVIPIYMINKNGRDRNRDLSGFREEKRVEIRKILERDGRFCNAVGLHDGHMNKPLSKPMLRAAANNSDSRRLNISALLRVGGSLLALCAVQPVFAQTPPEQDQTAGKSTKQTGPNAEETVTDDTDSSDIVVTGIRKSLENAQTIKRNANTIVDSITADDIGGLPDRSINEALQRVAGVAITRFASANDSAHFSVQGSGVTIRGLNYVRSEFNGRDVFAASDGRGLGFDDVPSELAGSVNVFKNLTADMIEGGIAGTVSVNTRKPFDNDRRTVFLSVGLNGGDLAQRSAPQIVGLFSDQWELGNGGRIGLLIGGSYSKQYSRADSIFLNGFQARFNAPFEADGSCTNGKIINQGKPYALRVCDSFPTPAGFSQVYTPLGAGFRSQEFDRQRNSLNASLQYENADRSFKLTGEYIRSYFDELWTERTIENDNWFPDAGQIFPAGFLDQDGFPQDPKANFNFDKNGVFTSGTLVHSGGPYGPTFVPGGIFTKLSNRSAYNKIKTQDASLNLQWSPTERLHVSVDGQYSRSNVENADDAINVNTTTNVAIDLNGKYPDVRFVTPGFNTATYLADGAASYYRSAVENRAINDGKEYSLRSDLSYDFSEDSFLREVRVGGRYAKREQTVRTNEFNNWGALSETWIDGGAKFLNSTPGLVGYYDFPNFFHGDVSQPLGAPFINNDILKRRGALIDTALLVKTPAAGFTPIESRGPNLIKGYFLPGEIYPNSEETKAAYISASFGHDFDSGSKLSGNIGLRYVSTVDESSGAINYATSDKVLPSGGSFAAYCSSLVLQPNETLPALCKPGVTVAQQQAALAFANGASTPNVARNTFDHWLPTFNLRFDASSKLLFRFAASKAISRPEFGQLRNNVGIEYNSITGGFSARSNNPYLRPVEAWQFDLTGEWYFAPVGSLTVALFYKDLKNIIVSNQLYTRTLTNNGATVPVTVSGPGNSTGKSQVKGAEFAYQQTYDFLPGALAGFGMQLSYTYIDTGKLVIGPPGYAPSVNLSETGNQPTTDITGIYENLPLEGLSKHNFNAALFYERSGFQARIAYSWRSRFLLTRLDCCFPFGPVYNEPAGQTDASISYAVNRNFRLVFEVQNLLDSTTKTSFILDNKGLTAPRSWFKSDRQFALTARLSL
jgi:TonB-dependent receptor